MYSYTIKVITSLNYLFNRKLIAMLFLGFSSGLPLALVGSTLQAWFKTSGVDIVQLGFLALLGQPYTYKFLWAPFIDRYTMPILCAKRGWILITQLLICLSLIVMSFFSPNTNPIILCTIALFLAFTSASQDIAFDAYKVNILNNNERGIGAAISVEGYRIAMLSSGGFALILADNFGWQTTYLIMAALMSIGIIAVLIAPEAQYPAVKQDHIFAILKESFKDFLKKDKAIWLLILIILYKLGDAFSHSFSTVFLLDLGFTLTAVGTINKFVGLIASLLGIFFGGILMIRIGLFRALLLFGILQAITNLAYMLLAICGRNYYIAAGSFFIESLCGGMGTAAFVALLMALCSKQYTATQFTLFSCLASLGRIYVGPVAGFMIKLLGWINFYFVTAIIAVPSLFLIVYLKENIAAHDK